jgi:hypothetical protein
VLLKFACSQWQTRGFVMVAFDPDFRGEKFSMAFLRMMNSIQTGPSSPGRFCVAGLEDASLRGGL